MNKLYLSTTILTAGVLASTSVFADAKFRPRVDVGIAAYDLEIIIPGEPTSTTTSTYLKAGIGGTIITGRWYFDLGYNGSINAEAEDEVTTMDFVRSDLTLTAGYVFPNNVTVFGGYKSGNSEFTNIDTFGSSIEFSADGIYGGAGMNFPSGGNVFSLNAAIAVLAGELTFDDKDPASLSSFTATADQTVGLSFGAGYSIPISNNSGFALKANYQAYDFTEYEIGGIALPDVSTTETILSFDVGYYATF